MTAIKPSLHHCPRTKDDAPNPQVYPRLKLASTPSPFLPGKIILALAPAATSHPDMAHFPERRILRYPLHMHNAQRITASYPGPGLRPFPTNAEAPPPVVRLFQPSVPVSLFENRLPGQVVSPRRKKLRLESNPIPTPYERLAACSCSLATRGPSTQIDGHPPARVCSRLTGQTSAKRKRRGMRCSPRKKTGT